MRTPVRRTAVAAGLALLAAVVTACAAQPSAPVAPPATDAVAAPTASPSSEGPVAVAPAAATSSTGAAALVPETTAPAAPLARATSATAAAAGPVPSSWEGGLPVLVAPRWRPTQSTSTIPWLSSWPRPVRFLPTASGPLSGIVIALDPGHDLGNAAHAALINKKYWVGFWKICNTTGTATPKGYPESTYAFDVAARLRRLLTAAGATVVVTRDRNTTSTYGPCIGARGMLGGQQHARLMVQIHADGGPSSGRGFHTIVPALRVGYTDDTYRQDQVLAKAIIAGMTGAGFRPATYLSSAMQVRSDQGAMTMSDVPITTVETLNMRNASDAAVASSPSGRQRIAAGLYAGIRRYLGR